MYLDKKIWVKAFLNDKATIKDAIKNLSASSLQICLVYKKNKILEGTITDGDIRRGLLNGLELNSSVLEIINKKPIISKTKLPDKECKKILQKFEILHLPVITKSKELIGLFSLVDKKLKIKKISNPIFIMAGGFGKRLGHLTKNCPKPMLKLYGKPILEHILESAKRSGFINFHISIYYLGHMIQKYFNNGSKWSVKINYIKEKKPLGTVGSLRLIKKKFDSPFIVMNCDVMSDINFQELIKYHKTNNSIATVVVKTFNLQNPYGVIRSNGKNFIDFNEKPITKSNISAGIYIFNPIVIDLVKQFSIKDIPSLFKKLKEKKMKTIVYPLYEPWQDVGISKEYFEKINKSK